MSGAGFLHLLLLREINPPEAWKPTWAQGIEGGAKRDTAAGCGRSGSGAPKSPVFACLARKNAPWPGSKKVIAWLPVRRLAGFVGFR
jgi:hypothetical protein